MASAAGFQLVTAPVRVVAMMASLTWVTSAAWKRRFASAVWCAVTSQNATWWAGLPRHCARTATASTARAVPSSGRITISTGGEISPSRGRAAIRPSTVGTDCGATKSMMRCPSS